MGRRRRDGNHSPQKKKFNKILIENFPNLKEVLPIQVQEACTYIFISDKVDFKLMLIE
jgi:hypothetical protein